MKLGLVPKTGLGNFDIGKINLDFSGLEIEPFNKSFAEWQSKLTTEDKRVLEENAKEIERQMELGIYEERNADYYRRNPVVVSDRVTPMPNTPTYIKEQEKTTATSTATPNDTIDVAFTRYAGQRQYELKDHLGNVRAVISDVLQEPTPGVYLPTVVSRTDYYPFGMAMESRTQREQGYL